MMPSPGRSRQTDVPATLAILASTLLWGTLWIPLRRLDGAGGSGAWATTAGFTLPLLVLLPMGLVRWRRIVAGGAPLLAGGFLMAAAIALYAEGLVRGQIARVILLFYLMPVWSTLLARLMLGDPITGHRALTVALGLGGMFAVFGAVPLPHMIADWMGLASGIACALSMVFLRRMQRVADFEKLFVQFLFLGVLFFLFTLAPGGRSRTAPDAAVLVDSARWLLAFGLLWIPGVLWLTLFGASRVEPGRVAILLMLEVVVGLASAALLTDEPLGPRELVGALLIMSACGAELLAGRRLGTTGDP